MKIRWLTVRPSAAMTACAGRSSMAKGRTCSLPSSHRRRSGARRRVPAIGTATATWAGNPSCATTSAGSVRRSRASAMADRRMRASAGRFRRQAHRPEQRAFRVGPDAVAPAGHIPPFPGNASGARQAVERLRLDARAPASRRVSRRFREDLPPTGRPRAWARRRRVPRMPNIRPVTRCRRIGARRNLRGRPANARLRLRPRR